MEKKFLAFVALAWCCAGVSAQTAPTGSTLGSGSGSSADSTRTAVGRDSVYKQVELGEVRVDGRTAIQRDDHISYMPTRRQVDASSSGVSLLARMMIPKLMVNLAEGSVKNADNTEPSVYIDNRKASVTEADRLRPKDIVRVEYYDRPSASFPGEATVLNFITRKYDRGGYVDARTTTDFFSAFLSGRYQAQVAVDTKKFNVALLGGTALSRDDAPGTSGTERYALPEPFVKQTAAVEGLTEGRTYYGKLRTTYRTDNTYVYADVGLNWDETPTDRHLAAVSYSPEAYPATEALTVTRSRNATPAASLYMYRKIKEGQSMNLHVTYSHGDNTYNRAYTEGELPTVVSDTRENTNRLLGAMQYNADLGHNNALVGAVFFNCTGSRATYAGTVAADQGLDSRSVMAALAYSHTVGKRLTLLAQVGPAWQGYRIKGAGRVSQFYVSPYLTARYAFNDRNSVSASWHLTSSMPMLSYFNTTEQRVNQYEVRRGNPDLKMAKSHTVSINYNLSLKNANISLFGSGNIVNDQPKALYRVEGETMVGTYVTDGGYRSYTVGCASTLYLLRRSLQLSAQLKLEGQKMAGLYAQAHRRFIYSLSASYFVGNFSFAAQYVPENGLMQSNGMLWEWPQYYYLSAAWAHKGWNVEVNCAHVFESDYARHSWFDYGAYSIDSHMRQNSLRSVGVKVAYSFDFGRKKVKRTSLEVEKGVSGIMKM